MVKKERIRVVIAVTVMTIIGTMVASAAWFERTGVGERAESTGTHSIDEVIFYDGFESGDLSAWISQSCGVPTVTLPTP